MRPAEPPRIKGHKGKPTKENDQNRAHHLSIAGSLIPAHGRLHPLSEQVRIAPHEPYADGLTASNKKGQEYPSLGPRQRSGGQEQEQGEQGSEDEGGRDRLQQHGTGLFGPTRRDATVI